MTTTGKTNDSYLSYVTDVDVISLSLSDVTSYWPNTMTDVTSYWPNTMTDVTSYWPNDNGCVEINSSIFQFHDDSKDVMNAEISNIVNNVAKTIVIPILFLIGFPSNVLNLLVFYRQGLRQRINLCLFWLSLMDLLLVAVVFSLYVEKMALRDLRVSYRQVGEVMKVIVNAHLLGCYSGFSLSSQFVSVVISVERCLCVVWPLKSRTALTTGTVGMLLLSGIVGITAGRFVVAERYRVVCVRDVATNLTTLHLTSSLFHRRHKDMLDVVDGLIYGLLLPVAMCGVVAIATLVTAVRLQESVKFQKESSSSSQTMSAREVALTRMLIYLSVQFIVLNTPNIVLRVSLLFLPQLSTTGGWANLYFFMMAMVETCAMLSSSLNILVYCFCGSKYRHTLHALLPKC